eukprot:6371070-Pyramimonas_sp.AAC.1
MQALAQAAESARANLIKMGLEAEDGRQKGLKVRLATDALSPKLIGSRSTDIPSTPRLANTLGGKKTRVLYNALYV